MSLRILHVSPYGPEAWAYGGIPRVVAGMTLGLATRGHRVTLCSTDAHDAVSRLPMFERSEMSVDAGAVMDSVERRIFPNLSNSAAYHLQAFAPLGLKRYLDAHAAEFDVAHLHACHNILGITAARALRKAGVPYVVSPNGTAPMIERRVVLKKMLAACGGASVLSDASRVLAVSRAEERQLEALGLPRTLIRRVPNPVEALPQGVRSDRSVFRRRHGIRGEMPLVLFMAKITPRKEADTVVEAFAQIQDAAAHLMLAGNDLGGLAPARARVRALGLESRTHVVGLLRGNDRLDALAAADVVVYPTRDEVFGLVACEALLAGTPVIVGSDSGCGEIVGLVGGGLTVPPGDPSALAAAIDEILGARAHWREAARDAAPPVRASFGVDVVASHLEAIYEGVCGRLDQRKSA